MKSRPGKFLSLLTFTLALFLLVSCAQTMLSQPAAPTPTVDNGALPDRLAAPFMPENPSQADLGAHVYYQVCMACHGDFGQGLTDEWREVWEEDANCWQRGGCHGPDHPDHGFEIPTTCCPAVLGENALTRFDNAQELFTYNSETMPWWNPGYLTREEFWQVTAFMMRQQGAMPNDVVLDEGNAFVFKLNPVSPLPENRRADIWIIAGILSAVAGLLFLQNRMKH